LSRVSFKASALAALALALAAGAGGTWYWQRARAGAAPAGVPLAALLPFENQTGDPQWDWLESALPAAFETMAGGAPDLRCERAASAGEASARGAFRVLGGRLTNEAGRLTLHWYRERLGVRLVEAHGQASADSLEALAGGVLPQVARTALFEGRGEPRWGAGRNPQAWILFARGSQQEGAAGAAAIEQALALDNGLGAAWLALVERAARRGGAAEALKVAERANAASVSLDPLDRARLRTLLATLKNDPGERLAATVELAQLDHNNLPILVLAASLAGAAREFHTEVELRRRAIVVAPARAEMHNQIGYALTFAGDLAGAETAFREYARLAPGSANPLDSLAEAYFYHGRWAEAERYFLEAHKKDPRLLGGGDLRKAAWARLASGDAKGAAGLMDQYLVFRAEAGDQQVELRRALWLDSLGRRTEAQANLAKYLAQAPAGQRSAALVARSLWLLEAGEAAAAMAAAQEARLDARTPAEQVQAALCYFAGEGLAARDSAWAQRALRAFPAPQLEPVRRRAVALGALLSRDFAAAAPALREQFQAAPPSDDGLARGLLAVALIQSGKRAEAANLGKLWYVPGAEGIEPLEQWRYPAMLLARANAEQAAGRVADARNLHRLFLNLRGAAPDWLGLTSQVQAQHSN
jgi:tetratricopeptide (TPR) repeat protein